MGFYGNPSKFSATTTSCRAGEIKTDFDDLEQLLGAIDGANGKSM